MSLPLRQPIPPLAQRLLAAPPYGCDERGLSLDGQALSEVAERFGTPLYVYSADVARQRLRQLEQATAGVFELYYAAKANPNPEVIRCFVDAGAGVEVSSACEFLRARQAGCAADRTLFAGPGKTPAELDHVLADGIGEICVESHEEIAVLSDIAVRRGIEVPCAIRVNPAAAVGGAMKMGGQATAFGFDEEGLAIPLEALLAAPGLRFDGLHVYAGTQMLDAHAVIELWFEILELGRRTARDLGRPLATLNFGGGLGIPYFERDRPLDLEALEDGARRLAAARDADPLLRSTRFLLEPGRFLVGPSGVYLCRVLSVKTSHSKRFVVLDGGAHHHLAATGNLGQVIKRDYPLLNASRPSAAVAESDYGVVGPLCTPLDTLARSANLPTTEPGDLIAVLQSGAYGLTASPSGFLSHPMPAEVLLENGKAREIRPRGTFEQPLSPLP